MSRRSHRSQCGTCYRIYEGTGRCPVCWQQQETRNVLAFIRSYNNRKKVDAYA